MICVSNLFSAWKEYCKGKRSNDDVAEFELKLEENLFRLHQDLSSGKFSLLPYEVAFIKDPKPRKIHIASVRDRVLFQAIYRKLYHVFDPTFIYDVYSSRNSKGTHAGVRRFAELSRKVSANFTKPAFVLKCDVRKFFDSIDHGILFDLVTKKIKDRRMLGLIHMIIGSLHNLPGKGLPLGNVTSQLFANIYMDDFDHFVKNELRQRYYIRYCDDFVILAESRQELEQMIIIVADHLKNKLRLDLHPSKVEIRKLHSGIDFLGYVSLPYRTALRTKTKKRMLRKIASAKSLFESGKTSEDRLMNVISSYIGMLKHCKSEKILDQIGRIFLDKKQKPLELNQTVFAEILRVLNPAQSA